MTWSKHKCICPLEYKFEPCGSLTLVGVRSQARGFEDASVKAKWNFDITYKGIEGVFEYDPIASLSGAPINLAATRVAYDPQRIARMWWPRAFGPFAVYGDVHFLADPRPRHQWRTDGRINFEEFSEWADLTIGSTVYGIAYDKWHDKTAITFAKLPTRAERFALKMRWA